MRKLFAFLVLLILPLQISFAVAAEYCEIEKADKGQHFGHHTHKGDAGKDSGSKKGKAEASCGFCQLGCAQLEVGSFNVLVVASLDVPAAYDAPMPSGHSPPTFDRPPRVALA